MATPEHRGDTVAVPGTAIKVAAGLATALIIGVTSVLWNLVLDNVRLANRLENLERFAKTGDRFTRQDADKHEQRIREMERWRIEHAEWAYAIAGHCTGVANENQRRLNKIEKSQETKGNTH